MVYTGDELVATENGFNFSMNIQARRGHNLVEESCGRYKTVRGEIIMNLLALEGLAALVDKAGGRMQIALSDDAESMRTHKLVGTLDIDSKVIHLEVTKMQENGGE